MKRIKVIASEKIINPETGKLHDDMGLKALDGYYKNTFQVEKAFNPVKFINELEENHPELKGRNFEITELQD